MKSLSHKEMKVISGAAAFETDITKFDYHSYSNFGDYIDYMGTQLMDPLSGSKGRTRAYEKWCVENNLDAAKTAKLNKWLVYGG